MEVKDLLAMADWLSGCGIDMVVMESTEYAT
jgi:hypothetical protein